MNRILTVASREIRGIFSSPLAYVFVAAFVGLAFGAFFVKETFFSNDQSTLRGFFTWSPWLMAFLCPALTMRLWADESRTGTYELLATLPAKPSELVLGKFFGAFAVTALALAFTAALPIIAESYGDLDWGPVIGGYLGTLFVAAMFLAMGLVTSACFQDQFLALLVGWIACGLAFVPGIASLPEFVRNFGVGTRFADIERGVISLSALAFYISIAGFWLFVNTMLIRWRRFSS